MDNVGFLALLFDSCVTLLILDMIIEVDHRETRLKPNGQQFKDPHVHVHVLL